MKSDDSALKKKADELLEESETLLGRAEKRFDDMELALEKSLDSLEVESQKLQQEFPTFNAEVGSQIDDAVLELLEDGE